MYTLKNNSKLTLIHENFKLLPGEIIDVPDKVGKIWLMINGIVEYKDPQKAKEEKAKLEAENEKLKQELAEVKKANTTKAKSNKKVK